MTKQEFIARAAAYNIVIHPLSKLWLFLDLLERMQCLSSFQWKLADFTLEKLRDQNQLDTNDILSMRFYRDVWKGLPREDVVQLTVWTSEIPPNPWTTNNLSFSAEAEYANGGKMGGAVDNLEQYELFLRSIPGLKWPAKQVVS